MRAAVILNKKAGSVLTKKVEISGEELKENFTANNIDAEIFEVEGRQLAETAAKVLKENYEIIIAAGGDGTISTIAGSLINTGKPLGILPLGTLNHFAKDLNIPLDIDDAVKLISTKSFYKIDAGSVNKKNFINNSSIGLYPKVVKKRDEQFERLGGRKWIAMGSAVMNVLKKYPLLNVKVNSHEDKVVCKTPFVFIGNNRYEMNLFKLGSRERLNEGKLSLYYPACTGKLEIFKFIFHAAFNRLHNHEDFNVKLAEKITLESSKKILEVSTDGEVHLMSTPLHYKILPGALIVIKPEEE